MTLFSERMGFVKPKDVLQIECASQELRMSLYNIVHGLLGDYGNGSSAESVCKELWTLKWHRPIDTFPFYSHEFYRELNEWVLDGEWYVCYDLLEFVYDAMKDLGAFEPEPMCFAYGFDYGNPQPDLEKDFQDAVNELLEIEGSGYRFINGEVSPITNELEIASLEQSLDQDNYFAGSRKHIEHALKLISKKPDPDYLGTCRESILAAESAAKKVTGSGDGTLSDAVKELQKTKGLHPALADAWKKMFGYTSDEKGMRHAGTEEPVIVDFAFAKYMLVTCSAFVNYLAEEFGQDEQR